MKRFLLPAVLAAILVACLVGWFVTREAASSGVAEKIRRDNPTGLVDDRLLKTAQSLAALADTPDGQASSKEALRLADRDVDQAYATALREAISAPPPAKGPLKLLAERIEKLKTHIAAEQAQIDQLSKAAAKNDNAADQLELAKAQLDLDRDELAADQQDLAKQGGDRHALLEREMQAHEAAQKNPITYPKIETAQPSTLYEQVGQWRNLGDRLDQFGAAEQQAATQASTIEKQHDGIEQSTTVASAGNSSVDAVTRLRRLSSQRKTLTELDKRIEDLRQLTEVYQRWRAQVAARRVAALHAMLASLSGIVVVILCVAMVDVSIRYKLGSEADRRKRRQLRVMSTVAVQFIGILAIALIVFGMPTQTSTLIGLATAGITVVLKDFIVSFFGWFVLMGKNGIHVGDWVEIEGVGGEVIEIGVLRTVLLEVGNWTDRGHPTGRRVAFVNKFAIEGHYFNFSTADQWLWDELVVSLPAGGDPYKLAQQILETVQRETETDAGLAEQDWQRATNKYGTRPFSAKPAVDLRPASGQGLEVRVRYITRAPQRYEVKSKLFEAIVELLHSAVTA
jgi:small-conductance mechanosensitive channel